MMLGRRTDTKRTDRHEYLNRETKKNLLETYFPNLLFCLASTANTSDTFEPPTVKTSAVRKADRKLFMTLPSPKIT